MRALLFLEPKTAGKCNQIQCNPPNQKPPNIILASVQYGLKPMLGKYLTRLWGLLQLA